MEATQLLENALGHLAERAKQYDAPNGERSMAHTVSIFNAITKQNMSEEQGWLFMLALKLARATQGKPKADSYEDLSAYSALLGEYTLGK